MKRLYFDVHVFFSKNKGYSIPVKIDTEEESLTDEQVVQFCIDNKKFGEEGDAKNVDYVDEITVEEYKQMVNC